MSKATLSRYLANGLYRVPRETKDAYVRANTKEEDHQGYIQFGLTKLEIEEVAENIEKQAARDVLDHVRFKTRERNSSRRELIQTTAERCSLRNDIELKNENMRTEAPDLIKNGLTQRQEVYILPRRNSSSPIRGVEVTQRVYAGETLVEELRCPAPPAPLDQESPWRNWDFDAGLVDAIRAREKYDKFKNDTAEFAKTPTFDDKKFNANDELPYMTNSSLEESLKSGGKTGEDRWEEALTERVTSKTPLRIQWYSSRGCMKESDQKAKGIMLQDPDVILERSFRKTSHALENKFVDERLRRQATARDKKVHFPRISYVKPNFSNTSPVQKHTLAYDHAAVQVEYPPNMHGIALFNQQTLGKSKWLTVPPEVRRERLKLLDETAIWCKRQSKYLSSRGILELRPDEGVLHNRHEQWIAKLRGPRGSPYLHGIFEVKIILREYPTKPPLIEFLTPIFHPALKLGPEVFLNIDWTCGAARWSHRLSLPAVAEIILHIMRFPENNVHTGGRASDVWENDDKMIFFREAASKSMQYAHAHNISEAEISYGINMLAKACQYKSKMENRQLSGAYLHYSPAFPMSLSVKKGKLAGHRVIISPEFRICPVLRKNEIKYPKSTFAGRQKQGCQWAPGRRMLYNGMAKVKKTDRLQRPSDSILNGSLSKNQTIGFKGKNYLGKMILEPLTKRDLEIIAQTSEESSSDCGLTETESNSGDSSSEDGYISDITHYYSNGTYSLDLSKIQRDHFRYSETSRLSVKSCPSLWAESSSLSEITDRSESGTSYDASDTTLSTFRSTSRTESSVQPDDATETLSEPTILTEKKSAYGHHYLSPGRVKDLAEERGRQAILKAKEYAEELERKNSETTETKKEKADLRAEQ